MARQSAHMRAARQYHTSGLPHTRGMSTCLPYVAVVGTSVEVVLGHADADRLVGIRLVESREGDMPVVVPVVAIDVRGSVEILVHDGHMSPEGMMMHLGRRMGTGRLRCTAW